MHTAQNDDARLCVIVVSYNTRALTLRCLETLFEQTSAAPLQVIVWDNASADGSADAVAEAFPQVELFRSTDNVGFARANNLAAEHARAPWLLLLNPDTEVHDAAVDRLLAFAEANPRHGIYGGRTVFPDGSLNIASCWNQITPWSAFCHAVGLTALFKRTALFDTEAIGAWPRDTVREVDIVVGCFLLTPLSLWRKLGGFDLRYWMYGEEADLCLRARALGYSPAITPDATIMHLVGAASAGRPDKLINVARARMTLTQTHWPAIWRPWGRAMMWLWVATRFAASRLKGGETAEKWAVVWRRRSEWMSGYAA
jgi:N-acetylglucosaminyl-diphospho-decaprenol L-rhamnosyltransferase